MGFTGNAPPQGDTVPNSYIVVLKPGLSDQDVGSHISSIKNMSDQDQAVLSTTAGAQTSFKTFTFKPADPAGDAAITADAPLTGFRGYMGTFSPSILERIQQSSQVI